MRSRLLIVLVYFQVTGSGSMKGPDCFNSYEQIGLEFSLKLGSEQGATIANQNIASGVLQWAAIQLGHVE